MNPPTYSLWQVSAGLLAFILGLYTLASRDQRSPYLTSAAYGTAFWVLVSCILDWLSTVIPATAPAFISQSFSYAARCAFGVGTFGVLRAVLLLRNRRLNFRDDYLSPSSFAIGRLYKKLKRRVQGKPTYSHNPQAWPQDLVAALKVLTTPSLTTLLDALEARVDSEVANSPTATLGVTVATLKEADEVVLPIAQEFLMKGCLVQYLSCSRHPVQFVASLRKRMGSAFVTDGRSKLLAVIDAYTPHFGFTDSIYGSMDERLTKWEVQRFESGPSYAGMHSASSKAFKYGKRLHKTGSLGGGRRPTLVIYEGCRDLIDLESAEQYRTFLRHVLPSEQLWGAMLTVFIEFSPDEQDKALLQKYADQLI